MFEDEENYLKIYDAQNLLVCKTFAAREFVTLYFIGSFMSPVDCILRDNGKILTISDLAEKMSVTRKTMLKRLKSLEDKKAIGFHNLNGENVITVNPYICFVGEDLAKWVYDYYKDSMWADKNINKN